MNDRTQDDDPINERRFLTRREAEILIGAADKRHENELEAHRREHQQESDALDKALAAERSQQATHNTAHDKAHVAHEEKHDAEEQAVKTALAAVDRERSIHSEAHEREHVGHLGVHALNNLAIDKAESANDKRFQASNAYKEQINELIRQFVSKESVDVRAKEVDRRFEDLRKDTERRYEDIRQAVAALERTDASIESKGVGSQESRAAFYAAIGATVTVVLAITSLIVFFNGLG